MQLNIKAPAWVLGSVAVGMAIGGVVALLFYTGRLNPEQTKTAIAIGASFWILAAIVCWATSIKIEAINPADHNSRPHLSGKQWKEAQDREQGWRT